MSDRSRHSSTPDIALHLSTATKFAARTVDQLFKVSDRGSDIGREVRAGWATFASMAYIVAVNPPIMANAGLDRVAMVTATILAASLGSLTMGLAANLPLAVAPAMGANVIFTYVIVQQSATPWPAALALVSITGTIFLMLSLSRYRALVTRDFPEPLKVGIQSSVGTLLVFYGLRASGLLVQPSSEVLKIGTYRDPSVLLAAFGLLSTTVLMVRKVPGSIAISIAVLTVTGLFVPLTAGRTVTSLPTALLAWPRWPAETLDQADFGYVAHHLAVIAPMLVYIVCAEFFTTMGALGGVARATGLARPDGSVPGGGAAFAVDAAASIVGPFLGTSVVTAYAESMDGVVAGGRTGLTSVMVAGLFLTLLFVWPVLVIIPPEAVAPTLVLVGIVMLQGIARIDMTDLGSAASVALTLLVTVITFDLIDGLALGTFVHLVNEVACGRRRGITRVAWVFSSIVFAYACLKS